MAITEIHPITSTLNLAIDYITNPHKTEEQKFVDCFDCSHIFAAYEFLREQEKKGYRGNTQAFHMIQSFKPGEVTPEQANEIGKKLADEFLKGQYEYVISTHIDKEHIHNHIIINAVNSETGKSFSTEHDRKYNPAWKQIREISDRLCAENNLSVIQDPERGSKGKDHYEWEQDKVGNSWKSKLKTAIDECIKTADSFEDFLMKMQSRGYEVKHGKYIAFRAEEQERFTRAKTLGFYYQEENIRFRIDRRLMYREGAQKPLKEKMQFVQMDDKIQSSEGLRRWAMLQNMQNASKLLNQLSERGIDNDEDLKRRLLGLYDERIDITDEIKLAEKEMTVLTENIRILRNYLDNRQIDEQYRKSKNKDKFFKEHESELLIFGGAKKAVKALVQDNGKLPNVAALEKRLGDLKNKKGELMKRYGTIKSEISKLEGMKKSIEKMERSSPEKNKSNER